ncbi:MAG: ABC transporter ATP-binding protein [Actinomycetota bacterium]|nr:ABC transporter ATP-binding protein [Actinomycetota bacterium]
MTNPSAIAVSGLEKHYGATRAVDGVSFDVAPGEVFGLLGPNGAGKTTTVEILEGYRRPDAGTVRVLDCDPQRDASLRSRMGVMLQEGGLYPALRARELLRLFAAYYEDPEDADTLLDTVGLTDAAGTPVRRLSGGQAQRLSLACAIVGRPDVVFLDEPTAGMDPQARTATWGLVRDLAARGATVLLTTHAMDEAEHLCDRVAIMAGGRLAALGTPAELTQSATASDVWFAAVPGLDTDALAHALSLDGTCVVEERPGEYLIRAPATAGIVADLTAFLRDRDVMVSSLRAGRQSLEAVFLQITAESQP